ncbi:nucleotide sugar dehydrogenase [Isoptericola sp. NEAU-Y5]|uniref:Nucleotide sugar dehydrogenase n=1 Tax=Isoptericola luteus TaxID=2879484 RepID=A0ABS7ZCF8_9MICO|nr:nucleotide sugar dehydrogenase [Isoptericola sp. NEAU-Y5]MCA5892735.1 nucleotide sugar dehydrogenase [Isoptericola sp. NEAU-Y5]
MSIDLVVIGLGYVGLPLAQEAVRAGLSVRGFDVSPRIVDGLNSGASHVDDLSDGDVQAMVDGGFVATADLEEIRGASAVVICVPTPLGADGGPDLGAVIAATRTVAKILEPGMLVVLESTTYPGTTEEVLKPILEEGGLSVESDFQLAYSPERIDPGNPVYGMKNTPKVVGGLTPDSTQRAADLYGKFVDTVVVAKGAREAETAKLLENTYRHINIALVNEMARFCHELDIDLWNVIDLAKTKPFGFQAFYPGPGVGGHCIPIDPNYLSHNVRSRLGYPFRFVELAQEINATMPTYVARRVQDVLNEDGKAMRGSKILMLGVTYKPDIADQRESPAKPLANAMMTQGADLWFHDPAVEEWSVEGTVLTRVPDLDEAVREADLVILVQNHASYDVDDLVARSRRFFDAKGASSDPSAVRL